MELWGVRTLYTSEMYKVQFAQKIYYSAVQYTYNCWYFIQYIVRTTHTELVCDTVAVN